MAEPKILLPEDTACSFNTVFGHRHNCSGVSVIIPIRGQERNQSLLIGIDHLLAQNCTPIEILIIEHDMESAINLGRHADNPSVKHLMLKESGPFNKSRAINCGVSQASYEFISMNDVDMIVDKTFLWNVYNILQKYEIAFTIKEIYYLSTMPSQEAKYFHNNAPWSQRAKWYCHGGNVSFRKTPFIELGAMNEDFKGHGSEDTEFYERSKKLGKVYDNRFATMLHMPHPVATNLNEVKVNQQKLKKYTTMDAPSLCEILRNRYYAQWGTAQQQISAWSARK